MASSTESVDVNGAHEQQVQTTVPASSVQDLSLDVQEEIDDLYDYVPEVGQLFEIVSKIGEGTFSTVFLARVRGHPEVTEMFALKHIIPTSHPSRIEQELSCLQEIGGKDNVMGVRLCIRHKDHVVIVMPYFAHQKFQDYIQSLDVSEVREYIQNLLIAVRRVHEFNIIHRDVKPSNFLYNRGSKHFALVDFGLAHKAPVPLIAKSDMRGGHKDTPIPDHAKRKPLAGSLENRPRLTSSHSQTAESTRTRLHTPVLNQTTTRVAPPKTNHYRTPPTPDIRHAGFGLGMKSPRRYVLAKRMLMANEKAAQLKSSSLSGRHMRASLGTCQCFGLPQVCGICTSRGNQTAPRAGTPGFRSPEVLMKHPDQTTAVDIWSVGVIFLSLLSGRYPFFRANDDLTALAQIISVMGSEEVKASAKSYGKTLITSHISTRHDLKTMCQKLRTSSLKAGKNKTIKPSHSDKENIDQASWELMPDSTYDLLSRLLELDPAKRITAIEALKHPYFSENL